MREQEQLMDEQMIDMDMDDDKIDFNTFVDPEPQAKRKYEMRKDDQEEDIMQLCE